MAKVTANNILSGSINTDKLDSSVVNNLTTAVTANNTATNALAAAQAAYDSANTTATTITNTGLPPVISSVTITDSSWTPLDDTAANTTGGYCVITGSGFVSGATVFFGSTSASAVTFANSTSLRVQVPTLSAASYPTYVVNPSGATAIKVSGLTTSSFPVWGTAAALANTAANTAFSVSLSANSDSSITYANTTALPAGTTLAANGYFSGTVSIGTETTYTFNVNATDAEYQNALRTFSLTVTTTPPSYLWTWGFGGSGQLGTNDLISRSSPVQIASSSGGWNSIVINSGSAAAVKSDGTLWVWGLNGSGRLGLNDADNRASPTQLGTDTNWTSVFPTTGSSVGHSIFALKNDNTVWAAAGTNTNGYLGLGNVIDRSSPVQVGGSGVTWSQIGYGNDFIVGIKPTGVMLTCGNGYAGCNGLNDRVYRSSPVQIGALTTWSKVSCGQIHTLAIKTDGTLWTWGMNNYGQLGSASTIKRSSPTQVGAGTTWSLVAGCYYSSFALKSDGTLWAWGSNGSGQLGQNNTTQYTSPVQISGTWTTISPGTGNNILAIKSNGTLWSWGANYGGPLGQNNTVYRSSPTQIGTGTNWTKITSGSLCSMAITS